jgi:FkbM family methyltransferase
MRRAADLQLAFIRAVAKRRRTRVATLGARAARAYLNAYANWDYDPMHNGEERVLRALASTKPRCVFDVGANEGAWALHAMRTMPGAIVHAFELIDTIAATLRARLEGTTAVVNQLGLSDEEGAVQAVYYPEHPELSAIGGADIADRGEARTARVTTGDAYCAQAGIERIDLLKIDTEGNDLRVLRGFDRLLGAGGVRAIQFEYGRANITSRALLADFYALLEGHGMAVGKIFPEHVDFRPYVRDTDEDFIGPNYLAVQPDLVVLLTG